MEPDASLRTLPERDPELAAALRASRAVMEHHATSYFLASRFLDRNRKAAIHAFYGFVRHADDLVDLPGAGTPAERLTDFENRWRAALVAGRSDDPILHAAQWVVRAYAIPEEHVDAFLAAMRSDLTAARYATYAELEGYMYGSAAVMGLVTARIFGYADPSAPEYAKDLGNAMQLTNFLRDLREDYDLRGRLYLPQDELARFSVTEAMIAEHRVTPEFKALMRFQVERARALYDRADRGIPMLSPEAQAPVTLARILYSKILDRIEAADYDVFSARRRVPSYQKARYALPFLWSRYAPFPAFVRHPVTH